MRLALQMPNLSHFRVIRSPTSLRDARGAAPRRSSSKPSRPSAALGRSAGRPAGHTGPPRCCAACPAISTPTQQRRLAHLRDVQDRLAHHLLAVAGDVEADHHGVRGAQVTRERLAAHASRLPEPQAALRGALQGHVRHAQVAGAQEGALVQCQGQLLGAEAVHQPLKGLFRRGLTCANLIYQP